MLLFGKNWNSLNLFSSLSAVNEARAALEKDQQLFSMGSERQSKQLREEESNWSKLRNTIQKEQEDVRNEQEQLDRDRKILLSKVCIYSGSRLCFRSFVFRIDVILWIFSTSKSSFELQSRYIIHATSFYLSQRQRDSELLWNFHHWKLRKRFNVERTRFYAATNSSKEHAFSQTFKFSVWFSWRNACRTLHSPSFCSIKISRQTHKISSMQILFRLFRL